MMKKIVYLLAIGFTFLLAGVFVSETLLLLFFVELIFPAGMAALAYYQSRRTTVRISCEERIVRGMECVAHICLENHSRLPLGEVFVSWKCEKRREHRSGRKVPVQKLRLLLDENGACKTDIVLPAENCGCYGLTVAKIQVKDYLGFFCITRKRNLPDTAFVCVYPKYFETVLPQPEENERMSGRVADQSVDGISDLTAYDLRTYRDGDALKKIHWKLYARTGELMIRHWMDTEDSTGIPFYLDLCGYEQLNDREITAFWEVAQALVTDLLRYASCHLFWRCADGRDWTCEEIYSLEQWQNFFCLIESSRTFPVKQKSVISHTPRMKTAIDTENVSKMEYPNLFDTGLHLYQNGRCVLTFEADTYEEVLTKHREVS